MISYKIHNFFVSSDKITSGITPKVLENMVAKYQKLLPKLEYSDRSQLRERLQSNDTRINHRCLLNRFQELRKLIRARGAL